jgi:hypothetical protein
VAWIKARSLAGSDQRIDTLLRQFDDELSLGSQHGEDFPVDLQRGRAEPFFPR